ncbi:MAG: O-methyltransferase [Acidobacteriota bacterium]|nr:O-methyltransferase [Acidobacteriota bacterium]MDH3530786.1 O-methyltransferase [Acidobacteriota bacterium]
MDIVDPRIQEYADRFTSSESEVLSQLRELTYRERVDRNMLSGFYQGRLLSMLSKLINPGLILEIGTYMGYSALCLAEGLREDGKLITLDLNEETNTIARAHWERTEYRSVIEDRLEPALDFIPTIEETLDLVFIDADKENYPEYFDLVVPKTRSGGLIIADNVLWSGDVLKVEKGKTNRTSSIALHEYNVKINSDPRVENILLTVRDGLMISMVK